MSSLFQNSYYLAINFNAILYGTHHASDTLSASHGSGFRMLTTLV